MWPQVCISNLKISTYIYPQLTIHLRRCAIKLQIYALTRYAFIWAPFTCSSMSIVAPIFSYGNQKYVYAVAFINPFMLKANEYCCGWYWPYCTMRRKACCYCNAIASEGVKKGTWGENIIISTKLFSLTTKRQSKLLSGKPWLRFDNFPVSVPMKHCLNPYSCHFYASKSIGQQILIVEYVVVQRSRASFLADHQEKWRPSK